MNQSSFTQENQNVSIEERITRHLQLMKGELANEQGPNFKQFWEFRKETLLLFKENLSSSSRSKLWAQYLTIADEARVARNHLEEDAKFASEQLELAIVALERENREFLENHDGILSKQIALELPLLPKSIEGEISELILLERKIQVLYIFASKVMQLREELVKIPMRMRAKAKYFERLSSLGDQIFPLRKELMTKLGDQFTGQVKQFADHYFGEKTFDAEKMKRNLFFFREEIKKFQALGQALSLQGNAFAISRKQLSYCWDQLKGMEKELKKELVDQKAKSAENALVIREKMAACKELPLAELKNELLAIQEFMRKVTLIRTDVVALKEELAALFAPLKEQELKEQEAKREQAAEEEAMRAKCAQEFLRKIEGMRLDLEQQDPNEMAVKIAEQKRELQNISLTKGQKQQLSQELKCLSEQLVEVKERRLLALSVDDQNALITLQNALKEKHIARKAIKDQIEIYRKKKGSRALDFLQALELEELIDIEKSRLEKLEQGIEEIETKISEML